MGVVLKILAGLVGLVVVLFALGFVLPSKVHVEREAIIEAPRERVFDLVSDFEQFNTWSPWADIDPETQYRITGAGVGQRMEWTSDDPKVGAGSQEIVALDAPEYMRTRLDFGDMGGGEAAFELEAVNDGATRVVWSMDTDMREGVPFVMKPVGTYMGFFMDGWVGADYERGLERLKAAAER